VAQFFLTKPLRANLMKNAIIMLSFVVLACSGCGTVAGHDDGGTMGGVDHSVYRGVRTDWQWAAHPEPETEFSC
jgi:uncharacterized protein YceK